MQNKNANNEVLLGEVSMKKVRNGKYAYKGFDVSNHGYYSPDKCVWWEAVNVETGCADYHAHTKREIKIMIDTDNPNVE